MIEIPEVGDRIELVDPEEPFDEADPGDVGTVEEVEAIMSNISGWASKDRQIWVRWDNGGTSALIYRVDEFEYVDDE